MPQQIVGISAKKQGGKTTMMRHIAHHSGKVVAVVCFANFLKEIVVGCFSGDALSWVTPLDLQEENVKNMVLPCGKTYRQMLQYVGTDVFRKLEPNCWVNAYKSRVASQCIDVGLILTPDVRFPNEVEAIHQMGGRVIRLTRAPFGEEDKHESETALDEYPYFDLVCHNEQMSIEEQEQWVIENLNRIV
jgi:hypothetical protein